MTIKYPKKETALVTYLNLNNEPVCVSTRNATSDYVLYEVLPDGNLNRLGKSRSLLELEKKYRVDDRMRNKT